MAGRYDRRAHIPPFQFYRLPTVYSGILNYQKPVIYTFTTHQPDVTTTPPTHWGSHYDSLQTDTVWRDDRVGRGHEQLVATELQVMVG